MAEERIKIRLPNAREKLQSLFPSDNRGDITIRFGMHSYKLQKAFLRLQSTYFKKAFSSNIVQLSIHEKFNPAHFTNVLKCFYGYTIEILRSEVIEYYPVVKFLEVESLIKILREDMIAKGGEHYDIFVLMQLAHKYDQQEIFQVCLSQLEKEEFEQLRYGKLQLLRCPMELFKMVIKTHNRMKAQSHKGIPFVEIDQLIKEFSEEKKLNEVQYQELKFELIDKNSLSSQEYKEIFLDDAKRKKNNEYCSMIRVEPDQKIGASVMKENPFISSRLTESLVNPMQKINEQLALQMEHTWQKKKNEELKAENDFLFKELEELKDITGKNKKMFDDLRQNVVKLQKQLEEKEKVDKEQNNTIKKLTKMCEELKKELSEKGQVIKKLQDKVSKLEKIPQKRLTGNAKVPSKYIDIDDEAEESRTIQSQIVPGHLLKEIAKPAAEALAAPPNNGFKKAKTSPSVVAVIEAKVEQEEPDDEDLQEMYTSRLAFDQEPRGCPKKYLPNLANFLTSDGFQKKTLNLLFRRNINNQDIKGHTSDLFNRQSLLVIICTRMNQVIGGFTSIPIDKNHKDYIRDDFSFIFSLTKNEKFNIKKNSQSEAIFLTSDYLICFSNDLMISYEIIKTQSQSDWPCAYEGGYEKRSSKWLTGEQGAFSIKEIEVYQVKEEAMEMNL